MEEAVVVLQGLRATLCAKPAKGKQQDGSALSVGLQEVLAILTSFQQASDVVLPALRLLEDVLTSCPQAATILRLEGGLKLLPRLLRSCLADEPVLSACGRVLARCASNSAVNQQVLAKEKGISSALLAALTAHSRSCHVVPPLVELLVGISRTARGAQTLAGEAMVLLARDLLVNFMGNWVVFGHVIKALKLQGKHEACAECLMRVNNGEVSRMLLAVARLLARLPAQRQTLKRTSRALWLLHRGALPPLPELEPLVPLPARDASHLNLIAAPDCTDTSRLMELVPEEFSTELMQAAATAAAITTSNTQHANTQNAIASTDIDTEPAAANTIADRPAEEGKGLCVEGISASRRQSRKGSGKLPASAVAAIPSASSMIGADHGPTAAAGFGAETAEATRPRSQGFGARDARQAHTVRSSSAKRGSTPSAAMQRQLSSRQLQERLMHSQGQIQEQRPSQVLVQDQVSSECMPPTAMQLTTAVMQQHVPVLEPFHECGPTYEVDMMMHDLRRLVHPDTIRGRQVYCSLTAQQQQQRQQVAQPVEAPGSASSADAQSTGLPPTGAVSRALASLQLTDAHHTAKAAARAAEQSGAAYGDLLVRTAVRNGQLLTSAATAVNLSSSPAQCWPADACQIPPLSFDSLFEGGNLRAAFQVYDNEYDLFLAPDLNDRSEGGNLCQWFYFSVAGVQPGMAYKFNLVNLRKKQSLFSMGKRPVVCLAQPCTTATHPTAAHTHTHLHPLQPQQASTPAAAPHMGASQASCAQALVGCSAAGGWVRAGASVAYYPSPYRGRSMQPAGAAPHMQARRTTSKKAPAQRAKRSIGPGQLTAPSTTTSAPAARDSNSGAGTKPDAAGESGAGIGPGLYCATFTLEFSQAGTYYVASCYPYTYTDLQEHLDALTTRLSCGPCPGTPQEQPTAAAATSASASPDPGTNPTSGSLHDSAVSDAGLHTPAAALSTAGTATRSSNSGTLSAASMPTPKPVRPISPSGTAPGVVLSGGIMARSLLCYSLAGHATDLITITDFSAPAETVTSREVVAITARVHPGETCASWIMQGLLDFLTSNDPDACMLRSSFVFKLVPMLNPDGVVNGSYRCSLAGCDLNRVWEKPAHDTHPTIHHTKRLLQALASSGVGRLALYIDIHGHSNKEDVFFYGCEPSLSAYASNSAGTSSVSSSSLMLTKQQLKAAAAAGTDHDTQPSSSQNSFIGQSLPSVSSNSGAANTSSSVSGKVAARLRVRMLPYLLNQINPTCWSFNKCHFRIRKAKLGAARVVLHRELGCAGAYTLEASLGGRSADKAHFTLSDYLNMGTELCRGIAQLAQVDDAALLEDMTANITLPSYNASSYAG